MLYRFLYLNRSRIFALSFLSMGFVCTGAEAESSQVASFKPGPLSLVIFSEKALAWEAHPLPSPGTSLPESLQGTLSASAPRFLVAEGDPVTVRIDKKGLSPVHFAEEVPRRVQELPLPFGQPDALRILGGGSSQAQVFLMVPSAGELTLREGETRELLYVNTKNPALVMRGKQQGTTESFEEKMDLRIEPYFQRRWCRAYQEGYYFFRMIDNAGNANGVFGIYLPKGVETEISVPDGMTGECVDAIFLSEKWPMESHLLPDELFQFEGFHPREKSGTAAASFQRWTSTNPATLRIPGVANLDVEIRLRLQSTLPPEKRPQNSFILFGGLKVPLDFETEPVEALIRLPAGQHRGRGTALEIHSPLWQPSEVSASRDRRHLGLLLDQISVTFPDPQAERNAPPVLPPEPVLSPSPSADGSASTP